MSFPKHQGNHQVRGISAASGELRRLEKPALDSNQFLNKPAANIIPPPDNPTGVAEVEEEFVISSFSPESTFQSRVFEVNVVFSEPIADPSVLPTRIATTGLIPVSVTGSWLQTDEEGTTFTGSIGELANELPNNTSLVLDFSAVTSADGSPITGETSFEVAVNYPT